MSMVPVACIVLKNEVPTVSIPAIEPPPPPPGRLVSPEPSPTNWFAVTTPVIFASPFTRSASVASRTSVPIATLRLNAAPPDPPVPAVTLRSPYTVQPIPAAANLIYPTLLLALPEYNSTPTDPALNLAEAY